MRTSSVSIALTVVTLAAVAVALAQQPAAPPAAPPEKTFTSAQEVQALIIKAKNDRKPDQGVLSSHLLSLEPYNVNLEYRGAVAPVSMHDRETEMFYIVEGTATLVTGGKIVGQTQLNPTNYAGTSIEGGTQRIVSKGDFVIVPEKTPHWFSPIGGNGVLVDVSIHLPRPVPSFAEMEKLIPIEK